MPYFVRVTTKRIGADLGGNGPDSISFYVADFDTVDDMTEYLKDNKLFSSDDKVEIVDKISKKIAEAYGVLHKQFKNVWIKH